MKKRILAALICSLSVLSMASCSLNSKNSDSKDDDKSVSDESEDSKDKDSKKKDKDKDKGSKDEKEKEDEKEESKDKNKDKDKDSDEEETTEKATEKATEALSEAEEFLNQCFDKDEPIYDYKDVLFPGDDFFGYSVSEVEAYSGLELTDPEEYPWFGYDHTLYYATYNGKQYYLIFNNNDELASIYYDGPLKEGDKVVANFEELFDIEPDYADTEESYYYYEMDMLSDTVYVELSAVTYSLTDEEYFRQNWVDERYYY